MTPEFIPPKPKSIVRAIKQVMAGLEAVAKTGENEAGGYQFATTDAIYAEVGRRMADAGLVIDVLEAEPTKFTRMVGEQYDDRGNVIGKRNELWGEFHYVFQLSTDEDSWTDPRASRTLLVEITGPQTHQAVQSFADKSYMRALFKIPTGDFDLDAVRQTINGKDDAPATNTKAKRVPRKSSAEGKRDGTVKVFNEIKDQITKAQTADQCRQVWLQYEAELKTAPARWFDTLTEDFVVTMKDFGIDIDTDADGWPILNLKEAA